MVKPVKAKADKPSNLYKSSKTQGFTRLLLLIVVGLLGFTVYRENDRNDEMNEHDAKMQQTITEYEHKLNSVEKDLRAAMEGKDSAEQRSRDLNLKLKNTDKKKDLKMTPEMEKSVTKQLSRLTEDVQRRARNDVLSKFGQPPYHIEFKLEYPPDEIPDGTADTFVIEMAPLSYMPYTVHFFLEQISRGLLNGCSFHRNAGHVMQGGPISNHLSKGTNVRQPFKDADLTSVAFQEYHEEFPHVKYTLGYAGRPGGPDFYVSTQDNTRNHGPGGQGSYAIKSEADPCFAKVIDGFAAVDRMQKMSVEPGGYRRMKHYVAIKSATIVKK